MRHRETWGVFWKRHVLRLAFVCFVMLADNRDPPRPWSPTSPLLAQTSSPPAALKMARLSAKRVALVADGGNVGAVSGSSRWDVVPPCRSTAMLGEQLVYVPDELKRGGCLLCLLNMNQIFNCCNMCRPWWALIRQIRLNRGFSDPNQKINNWKNNWVFKASY